MNIKIRRGEHQKYSEQNKIMKKKLCHNKSTDVTSTSVDTQNFVWLHYLQCRWRDNPTIHNMDRGKPIQG